MFAKLMLKLGEGLAVVFVVLAVAFVLFQYAGDPVAGLVGQDTDLAARAALRNALGLNDPLWEQFGRYVWRALQGELGFSYQYKKPVMSLIFERLPATLELSLLAGFASLAIGLAAGVFASIYQGKMRARAVELAAVGGISLPPFVVSLLLILVFAAELKVLPAFGRGETVRVAGWETGLLTSSGRSSIILPMLSLIIFQVALVMRLTRAQMVGILAKDYIRFSKARGLPDHLIYLKHALRNALPPVLTVAGLQLGSIIAFSVVTETVFQWPGVGLLFIQAVTFADFPLMAGYLFVVSILFVLINLITDAVVLFVDPRSRRAGASK
ncbi:peptide/nickel transport system permease protein [Bosea sp. AK1]|uniref:ABC transporter permease n=1 Tax=Bosea sp. AK1 TaxID=2587160 RepID=UPI00114DC159|nr:ABC transporter permease [Bosea sp. AK1]TQI65282.1 peptide/nickel transport system permease protein [Bosea sp. AK1]